MKIAITITDPTTNELVGKVDLYPSAIDSLREWRQNLKNADCSPEVKAVASEWIRVAYACLLYTSDAADE